MFQALYGPQEKPSETQAVNPQDSKSENRNSKMQVLIFYFVFISLVHRASQFTDRNTEAPARWGLP